MFFESRYSSFLANLQEQLHYEYSILLRHEFFFWKIKARILWLNDGDACAKFFHKTVVWHQRHNSILGLKNDDGRWIFTHDSIHDHIVNYFQKLFSSSKCVVDRSCSSQERSPPHC